MFIRIRQRDNLSSPEATFRYYYPPEYWYQRDPIVGITSHWNKVLGSEQVVLDNGKTKFRKGASPNPVDMRKFESSCTTGIASTIRYGYGYPIREFVGPLAAFDALPVKSMQNPLIIDPNMLDLAAMKAYAKISSASIDIGENLNDLRKTVDLLKSPLKGIVKAIGKMGKQSSRAFRLPKPGLGARSQNFLKAMSDRWLEYRYGIMPLILDFEAGRKMVNKGFFHRHSPKKTARSSNSTTVTTDVETREANFPGITNTWLNSTTTSYGIHCGWYYYTTLTRADFTRFALGLDIYQFPALVWEIIPYSFVLDWFVNVGDWIKCITPDPYTTILGSFASAKESIVYTRTCQKSEDNQLGGDLIPTTSLYQGISSRLLRTVNMPLSVTPKINTEFLNLQRSIDSLSLLWQTMPRMR